MFGKVRQLSAEKERALIASGKEEKALAYLKKYELQPGNHRELIKRGNHALIMGYIQAHKGKVLFDSGAMELFLARGNHTEIMVYADCGCRLGSPDMEAILIGRGNHEEIMAFIAQRGLCFYHSEMLVVERGNKEEIFALISFSHNIGHLGQAALIKQGNHEFIMKYLAHCNFHKLVCPRLLERGNHEEIMAQLRYGQWPDFSALIERGNQKEILAAAYFCSLMESDLLALINYGYHDAIMMGLVKYLQKNGATSKKIGQALRDRNYAEELFIWEQHKPKI